MLGCSISYNGIITNEMGDTFAATLYGVAENGTVYCNAVSGSITSYLYGKPADGASSGELKTLAVDMLNYGDSAAVYLIATGQ